LLPVSSCTVMEERPPSTEAEAPPAPTAFLNSGSACRTRRDACRQPRQTARVWFTPKTSVAGARPRSSDTLCSRSR